MKDQDSFQKVISRGKGGKKGLRQPRNEGKKVSKNKYQVLEENAEMENGEKSIVDFPEGMEMEMVAYCNPSQEVDNKKEHILSEMEREMDQEMIQSEIDLEDHELQEILGKENLDLEGFLGQGSTGGIDSLLQEDCNKIQKLFLWKTQDTDLENGKISEKQERRGLKIMKAIPGLATRNAGKNKGRKKKKDLLMECGKLMIDSGKMKDLNSYSFTNL